MSDVSPPHVSTSFVLTNSRSVSGTTARFTPVARGPVESRLSQRASDDRIQSTAYEGVPQPWTLEEWTFGRLRSLAAHELRAALGVTARLDHSGLKGIFREHLVLSLFVHERDPALNIRRTDVR